MTPERFQNLTRVLDRRQPDLTVLAEDVHKTHNIAALLRTCDAVGIPAMHVVSPGGEFRRHHMVAGGSTKWVQTHIHADIDAAIFELKQYSFQIIAADISEISEDYRAIDYTGPTTLLLGSERDGLSAHARSLADRHVHVPMRGLVSSLNVSVACALILFEAARQREQAGMYRQRRLDSETFARTLFEWCYPEVARRCRHKSLPYPDLNSDGCMVDNPLAEPSESATPQGT